MSGTGAADRVGRRLALLTLRDVELHGVGAAAAALPAVSAGLRVVLPTSGAME